MNKIIKLAKFVILSTATLLFLSCSSNNDLVFSEINQQFKEDNYFKARDLYLEKGRQLSKPFRYYTEALIYNAFNQLKEAEKRIDYLTERQYLVPDSLLYRLYTIKSDNAIKQYQYKTAKEATETILANFKIYLTEKELSDYENSLKIWCALDTIPSQSIDIKGSTIIKMQKDKADLNNLKISANNDTLNFIFDTGANLSTTSVSVANRLGMKIIPADIKVGTITGGEITAQLGICSRLLMGNIELNNVVFLVMPDEALSFPQIDYHITGILGFPVIEALKEIQITQNGEFIVPETETAYTDKSNMAMNGLTPLICLDNRYFTFDTGADLTMFYHRFYVENKEEIDTKYQQEKIGFGGAGGSKEFDGFKINHTFNIFDKEVKLEQISLLKEKIKENETVYGNIGQDIIKQFEKMTINFNHMFILFE